MISIRTVDLGDKARLLLWRNLPEVRQWMYSTHLITEAEHEAWFASAVADPARWYWVIEVDDRPAGMVSLARNPGESDDLTFGIYIGEPWARGIGAAEAGLGLALSYAFDVLHAASVRGEAFVQNRAATSLYARMGFETDPLSTHQREGSEVVRFVMRRDGWMRGEPSTREQLERDRPPR